MFKPYFIKPETIHTGDTVRAVWNRGDVIATAQGRVASVVADGPTRTFYTEDGEPIFTYVPGELTRRGAVKVRVTLIEPALTRSETTLPGMDFASV